MKEIALIATPIVLNLIKSAKKGAFARSVEGVVKSAKTYYLETLVNMEPSQDVTFTCDNSKCISNGKDLGVTGSMGYWYSNHKSKWRYNTKSNKWNIYSNKNRRK